MNRAVKNGYRHQGHFPPLSDEEMIVNVTYFLNIVSWVSKDEKLPNLNDLGSQVSIPKDCNIEPVAIFYDDIGIVSIDQEIWDSLDSLSQAALIIHELNYRNLRNMVLSPDVTSKDTRIMTAIDFSTNLPTATQFIPSNLNSTYQSHCAESSSTSCSQSTKYYLIPPTQNENGNQKLRIQFVFLAGRVLKTLTTIDLPKKFVNDGDIYPINSKQLLGWTAEVIQDKTRFDGYGVKLLIRRGSEPLLELPL